MADWESAGGLTGCYEMLLTRLPCAREPPRRGLAPLTEQRIESDEMRLRAREEGTPGEARRWRVGYINFSQVEKSFT